MKEFLNHLRKLQNLKKFIQSLKFYFFSFSSHKIWILFSFCSAGHAKLPLPKKEAVHGLFDSVENTPHAMCGFCQARAYLKGDFLRRPGGRLKDSGRERPPPAREGFPGTGRAHAVSVKLSPCDSFLSFGQAHAAAVCQQGQMSVNRRGKSHTADQ